MTSGSPLRHFAGGLSMLATGTIALTLPSRLVALDNQAVLTTACGTIAIVFGVTTVGLALPLLKDHTRSRLRNRAADAKLAAIRARAKPPTLSDAPFKWPEVAEGDNQRLPVGDEIFLSSAELERDQIRFGIWGADADRIADCAAPTKPKRVQRVRRLSW